MGWFRGARVSGVVLALVVLAAGAAPAAETADIVGEVLRVRPPVTALRGGEAVALAAGAPLHRSDVVETGDGARAQVRLGDGSVLTMGANTKFEVPVYEVEAATGKRAIRVKPLAGIMQATVAKAAPQSRFEVELAFSVASVRSTELAFELQSDRCVVAVQEGAVSVRHKDPRFSDREVLVRAGEGTWITGEGPPNYAAKWSDARLRGWLDKVGFE